jgi:hypothetical protein
MQAGLLERPGHFREEMSIRRQRELDRLAHSITLLDAELRELADKIGHVRAQQRLATSEPDLLNPELDKYLGEAQIIREWQLAVDGAFVSSAAIDALVVAAVRDGNAQVGDGASEFVGQAHGIGMFEEKARNTPGSKSRFLSKPFACANEGGAGVSTLHPRGTSAHRRQRHGIPQAQAVGNIWC